MTVIDDMEATIERLNSELSPLRGKHLELTNEAKRLREERDRLNLEHRSLVAELKKLRARVKEVNQGISDLSEKIAQKKEKVNETLKVLTGLRDEINLVRKQVKTPFNAVRQEMDDIEWELQTSPTEMQKERRLMKRLKALSVERGIYERAEDLRKRMVETKVEIESFRLSMRENWGSLRKLLEERKLLRHRVSAVETRASTVKDKADDLHSRYIKKREEVNALTRQMGCLTLEVLALREKIAEREEVIRKGKIKDLAYDIRERMKRGEKITFQELQVLSEAEGSS